MRSEWSPYKAEWIAAYTPWRLPRSMRRMSNTRMTNDDRYDFRVVLALHTSDGVNQGYPRSKLTVW